MAVEDCTFAKGVLSIAEWTGGVVGEYAAVGNVSEFKINYSQDKLEHIDHTSGTEKVDLTITKREKYSLSFITDAISDANIARFMRGSIEGDTINLMSAGDKYYALKFVSNNPFGKNRVFEFNKVNLIPTGDLDLVGTEWSKLSFSGEILADKANNPDSPYGYATWSTTTTTTTTVP